ncbi:hypothetical protein TVAG_188020 [Trichomonas vaginalis G3]|uniref:Chromo domain-containing protein n=1 Tax=Trichomonas vaginalis (strain ATCC PRA-98 / G3) TaxID=412133 RepID=A2DV24_TRIV3|nr:hypothetical protein TVAG_188020 [Trichomonas vaginalis G3]|eukprot:XP_001327974.1 hypothetical protein [Trichomonas vaginalis G3]
MSEEDFPYDKILGVRKTEGRASEYLVKYKGQSYQKLEWVQDTKIRRYNDGQNFIARANRSGIKQEPPFYDPEYEIIDKIVSENDNKFLVKWKKLGYDQLTWETTADQLEIARYRHMSLQTLPTLDESMQRPFVFPDQPTCPLSSNELISYNYLKNQILTENLITITDKYCFRSTKVISAIISDLLLNPEEKGPFLILTAYDEVEDFNIALHECSFRNHPACYVGSKDSKAKMNELDMVFAPHVLKYNVMITTPDMFVSELDYFKNISWRLLIVNDNQTFNTIKRRHYKEMEALEVYKRVKLDFQSLSSSLNGLQHIVDDLMAKEFKPLLTPEEHTATENVKKVIDPIIQGQHKRGATNSKNYTVNCPINEIQCLAIQRAIYENRDHIKENDFFYLAQKIFRCIHHPLIAYGDLDVKNIDSSTKMQVLMEMIKYTVEEGKSLVVISQFITFLDILEDILRTKNFMWRRFTRVDASAENGSEVFTEGKISVFLFDSRLSSEIDLPLHIIDKAVLIDEPLTCWMNILRTHREGRISVSKVSEIYKLEEVNLNEEKLFSICNDSSSPQYANIESICRKASISASVPSPVPDEISLLNAATLDTRRSNKGEDGFDIPDFWNVFFEVVEEPKLPILQTRPEGSKWTVLDRENLVRWIQRVGLNRTNDLIKLSRLNFSPDEVTLAVKSLIREVLRLTQSLAAFPVARSVLSQDTDEDIEKQTKFINEKPFSDLTFVEMLRLDATQFLRRLENLFYIYSLFEKNPDSWTNIPPIKIGRCFTSTNLE